MMVSYIYPVALACMSLVGTGMYSHPYMEQLHVIQEHLQDTVCRDGQDDDAILQVLRAWPTVADQLTHDERQEAHDILLMLGSKIASRAQRLDTLDVTYASGDHLIDSINGARDEYFRSVYTDNLIVTGSFVAPILNIYVQRAGDSMTGPLVMESGVGIVFNDESNSNSTTIESPTTLTTTYTLFWPTGPGNNTQLLTSDTYGQLYWSNMYTPTAGIYSLNGLTEPVQSFTIAPNNTGLSIQSVDTVHTFSLGSANTPGVLQGTISNTQVLSYNGTVTTLGAATSSNIPNTLVLRDGSGSFSAQDISAQGNLTLPTTTAAVGGLLINGTPVLQAYGTNNIFVGTRAGNVTMTGGQNATFGVDAFSNNTTGSFNVVMGYAAGVGNTTGEGNTLVGASAGHSNTNGNFNTVVGYAANANNHTGSNNAIVGTAACFLNTVGSNNVAMGYQALSGNTTGTNNVGIGYQALYNSNSNYNVGIGSGSLYNLTTGASNVALGTNAGVNNTTGSNNIYIGSQVSGTSTDESVCYINNIYSTNLASGPGVIVNSNNQLGVGSILLANRRQLIMQDGSTNTVSMGAPTSLSSTYTLLLPVNAGSNGQVLSTNGSGTLSWISTFTGGIISLNGQIGSSQSFNTSSSGTTFTISSASNVHTFSLPPISNSVTANSIVLRDGYGNINGGDISASGNLLLPSTTLSAGQLNIGGYTVLHAYGTQNIFVGQSAGNLSMSGYANTAVGGSALTNNTTGYYNTAVGYSALKNNTTGYFNNAVGGNALTYNTTGYFNNAVGGNALTYNTTGHDNTAIGDGALLNNTTGYYNTAIGDSALTYNTTGHDNTAIGYQAGETNNSFSNVFIGSQAGYGIVTGIQNTVVGTGALGNSISGADADNNVAVGFQALAGNNTANTGANTAIGCEALGGNTTSCGTGNIAIGFYAGTLSGGGAVGDNNIYIGTPAAGGGSSNIYIGNPLSGASSGDSNVCRIANIWQAGPAAGAVVYCNSNNQLGTPASSARYKTNIVTIDPSAGNIVDQLNPVQFNYKDKNTGQPWDEVSFGLIAEEVAELNPDLVIFDDKTGLPETVRYHYLDAFYIAKMQALQQQVNELSAAKKSLEEKLNDVLEGQEYMKKALAVITGAGAFAC